MLPRLSWHHTIAIGIHPSLIKTEIKTNETFNATTKTTHSNRRNMSSKRVAARRQGIACLLSFAVCRRGTISSIFRLNSAIPERMAKLGFFEMDRISGCLRLAERKHQMILSPQQLWRLRRRLSIIYSIYELNRSLYLASMSPSVFGKATPVVAKCCLTYLSRRSARNVYQRARPRAELLWYGEFNCGQI